MPNRVKFNGKAWTMLIPVLGLIAGFVIHQDGKINGVSEALAIHCQTAADCVRTNERSIAVIEERQTNQYSELVNRLERIENLLRERD